MNPNQNYLQELQKRIREAIPAEKKSGISDLKKYIGTSYNFSGLSVPTQRKLFNQGYSFSHLAPEEQLIIWDRLWKSATSYEVLTQALFFVEKHKEKLPTEMLWNVVKTWVFEVDNWAHSDGLSGIYAYLLEEAPKLVYPQLKCWNTSPKPWERRQSLLSLLEYHKKRKKILPLNKMLPLVKNLIYDENVFVQKAVGWTLREIGMAYPEKTRQFLIKHATQLSAAAFATATEKTGVKDKIFLKSLRKAHRTR